MHTLRRYRFELESRPTVGRKRCSKTCTTITAHDEAEARRVIEKQIRELTRLGCESRLVSGPTEVT